MNAMFRTRFKIVLLLQIHNAVNSHQDSAYVLSVVVISLFVQKGHPKLGVSGHVVVEVAILSLAFACVMANVSRGSTKKRHGGHLLFRKVREKIDCSFHHLDDAHGQS